MDIVEPSGVSVETDSKKSDGYALNKIIAFISKFMPELIFEILEIIYNVSAGRKLNKAFREHNYDFFYERYALLNWCGVRAAGRAKVPAILEVNYTCQTPLYRRRSKIMKPIVSLIENWTFKKADGIVVVSTYLKDHLIQRGFNKDKIIILTNAADPDRFKPNNDGSVRKKYKIAENTVIGFVGGFYPWHGLDLLFNVFKYLSDKYGKAILLLVGDGPMKLALEKKVIEFHLGKRVIFPGCIPNHELDAYIAAFDIAVMPHSNEYGSPMKIYEYMAMEKAVIAPKLGPLIDGINHGENGLLFEPENEEHLRESLCELLDNETLRKDMGKKGRLKILKQHNWNRNGESVINLFAGIVQGSTRT